MSDETHRSRDDPPQRSGEAIERMPERRTEAKPDSASPGPRVPANKARQGRLGWPVLFVLVAALLLAALAWWGAEIYGVAIEPEHPVGDPAQPSTQPPPAR